MCTHLQCHNRVMFKQFLQASALQFVQIDSCRVGSVNENLAIILMAAKFNGKSNVNNIIHKCLICLFVKYIGTILHVVFAVPVCPHAGGVGLCELVQHLILFDYISVSASLSNRYVY